MDERRDAAMIEPALRASATPAGEFDVALVDLDGVVYLGDHPVPGAAEALAAATHAGMRHAFVTNNALRTPDAVAAKLVGLGVPATPDDVVTSAQAAARMLAELVPAGSRILVAGGDGLHAAVLAQGFTVVRSADEAPAAVAAGYDPTIDYPRLAEAALAIRRGAVFVAANRDATVPTPRGPQPGMGAITAFLVTATDREPHVAGKPDTMLHRESVRRTGARHPLVVGDRLDTDIEGARRVGAVSLLVLSGVTDVAALLAAPSECRPDLIASDLGGLLVAHPEARAGHCGAARATYDAGTRRVTVTAPAGAYGQDGLDPLRAAVTAAWTARDASLPVEAVDGLP